MINWVGLMVINIIIRIVFADFPFAIFSTISIDVEAWEDFGEVEGEGGGNLRGEVLGLWKWAIAVSKLRLCIMSDTLNDWPGIFSCEVMEGKIIEEVLSIVRG